MSTHWVRTSTVALASMGIAVAFTGFTFAQSPASVANTSIKSSAIEITPNLPHSLAGQHGIITLTPLGKGRWQASWTWSQLGKVGIIGPITLWGWEGTKVGGNFPNIDPTNESTPTKAGDTVTIDFTQPSSYPAHPEVVQFRSFLGELGIGPTSPVGQLPEVPWAAALPMMLIAPLAIRVLKH